jgi:hypothetical protein
MGQAFDTITREIYYEGDGPNRVGEIRMSMDALPERPSDALLYISFKVGDCKFRIKGSGLNFAEYVGQCVGNHCDADFDNDILDRDYCDDDLRNAKLFRQWLMCMKTEFECHIETVSQYIAVGTKRLDNLSEQRQTDS